VKDKKKFVAPCGLYCGACSIRAAYNRKDAQLLQAMADGVSLYLGHKVEAKDLACKGCLSDVVSISCRECKIRDCGFAKGLNCCSECTDSHCELVTNFNNDGLPHHAEVLKDIRRQKEVGVDSWLAEQDKRWRCPSCSAETDWYANKCHSCGADLSGHF
jgi:hypothetical protein